MNIKLLEDLENKVIKPKGQIPFSDFDKISSEVVGKADFAPEFIIDGMVKRLRWDRKKPVDRAVMLISANDPVGVMLDGLKRGDTISIVSIDGIASFANGSWLDKFISGILSVAGELGKLFSDELTDKVIDAAIEKIKKELKEKKRDGYGQEDPPNGEFHTHEGGVLICVNNDIYYSGADNRHIKKHAPRFMNVQPDSIPFRDAFFAVPPRENGAVQHNTRVLEKDGSIVVVAYDWKFSDNVGFYKVVMDITKGPM